MLGRFDFFGGIFELFAALSKLAAPDQFEGPAQFKVIPRIDVSSAVFARLRDTLKGSSTHNRLS